MKNMFDLNETAAKEFRKRDSKREDERKKEKKNQNEWFAYRKPHCTRVVVVYLLKLLSQGI